MANITKSNTSANQKDYWRTPPNLVDDALNLLGIDYFDCDVCCTSPSTGITETQSWITESDNAFHQNWFFNYDAITKSNVSFCNPPFSLKWEFVKRATEQVKRWHQSVLMVLPYTPTTKQWHDNIHDTDCIIYVPDGRYQYLLPDGSKPKNSCNFETCLVLIVPFKCGNVIVNYKRGLDG